MSTSYTPPTRPDGYTLGTSRPSSGQASSDRSATADRDGRPVKPRGHARADLGLLVLRLGLAAIMLAHGYQKLVLQGGFAPTQASFARLGVPFAGVSGILELAGGVAMAFGLFTVLVGLGYAAAMAAAIWYVHRAHGFFIADNGYEFVGLVGVVALVLAISGAGRISLDRAVFGAKRRRRIREARDAGV